MALPRASRLFTDTLAGRVARFVPLTSFRSAGATRIHTSVFVSQCRSEHSASWKKDDKTPLEYINEVPPIEVDARVTSCEGGGGPLGHPLVYINLDKDEPASCMYCGLRFVQKKQK